MRKATLALAVAVAALTIGATTAHANDVEVYDLDQDPQGSTQCSPVVTSGGVVSGGCDLPLQITEPFGLQFGEWWFPENAGCEMTLHTKVGGVGQVAVHDVEFNAYCDPDAAANNLPWAGGIASDGGDLTADLPIDIDAGSWGDASAPDGVSGTKQFEITDPDADNLWTFYYYEEEQVDENYSVTFGGDFDSQSGHIDIVSVN